MTRPKKPAPLGYGDGSVFQRKSDGRYIVKVYQDGKRVQIGSSMDAHAAHKILEDYNKDRAAGLDPTGRDWTTEAWLEHWLATHEPRYDKHGERIGGVEPTTFEKYETQIRRHILPYIPRILSPELVELSKQPAQVVRWRQALHAAGLGGHVQNEALQRLSAALDMAVGYDLISRNPADKKRIKRPKLAKPRHVKPSELDLVRLIRAIKGDPLEALVWIAMGSGLRRGEVAGLDWGDVSIFSPEHGLIRTHQRRNRLGKRAQQRLNLPGDLRRERTKSQDERTIDIGAIVIGILEQRFEHQLAEREAAGATWRGPDYGQGRRTGYLFTTPLGSPLEVDAISKYMTRVRRSAGLDIQRFHSLRRVFSTLLDKAGVSDRVTMELGGWADLDMTHYYQDPMASQKRDAALALNGVLEGLLEAAK